MVNRLSEIYLAKYTLYAFAKLVNAEKMFRFDLHALENFRTKYQSYKQR
jgi:hypothetical protein